MEIAVELAVLLALTLGNAFFSGAEIAMISVRKSRLLELADEGRRAARAVLTLRQNPERFLATVQVGITVIGATSAAFGGAVMEQPIADLLRSLGVDAGADAVALALVVALVSFLSIVLGELVPKSLALRSSEGFALFAARPLGLLSAILSPAVWFLTAASNLILRPFSDTTNFTESRLTREEVEQIVEDAVKGGSLDPGAGDIATRAIQLPDLRVGAVMVPRVDATVIDFASSADEIKALLRAETHSRYVVMREDREEVLGYVTASEIYAQLLDGELDLRRIMRDLPIFPEQKRALDALRDMQAKRTKIGVVVDELGTFVGLVTAEDVAEELVGEILAEGEAPVATIAPEEDGTYLLDATLPIHELNRDLDLELPLDSAYVTLGGLISKLAGRIPRAGARFELAPGVVAHVVDASPRQVRRVRLELRRPSPD